DCWSNFGSTLVGAVSALASREPRMMQAIKASEPRQIRVRIKASVDVLVPCAANNYTASGGEQVPRSLDDRKNILFVHDKQRFAVDLDFSAGVARETDAVAFADLALGMAAVLEPATIADGKHSALLRLFPSGVGQDDSTRGFSFGIQTLDHHMIAHGHD